MGRLRLRKHVVEAPEPDTRFSVPPRFNFTRDVVEAAAAADGRRPAMTFVDHEGIIDRRTYGETAHDASRWASLLRSRGLEVGDRVVVLVGRTPRWHSIVLGALKGGFVVVPCPGSFDADELLQRAAHCDARAVITERASSMSADDRRLIVEDLKDELREHPVVAPTHDTAADDPAFILYTAGTSGTPKGAVHTHASTWMMRLQAEHWLDARPADLVWCTAEPGEALFVWNSLIGPWSRGAEIAIHERAFDVEERFDLIGRLGATILCQPPSEYRQMVEHPALGRFSLGRVRHAVSTGAPLEPATVDAFRRAFGITIHDAYGQAETGILVASRRRSEVGAGSLGEPLPGYDIAVLDAQSDELPVGVEGEIALGGRPPSLCTGYWNDPHGTDAAFRGDWYVPGDRATRDPDGCLWFAGRSDRTTAIQAHVAPPVEPVKALPAEPAVVVELAEEPGPTAATGSTRDPPTSPKQRRREQAAARRAERAAAKAVEQQRRQDERRRRDEESAAEEQARREKAEAKRAADAKAREEATERKRAEKRRRDEEKAAAEQTRRDEAEAKRAADAKAREEATERKRAEKRRRDEEKAAAEQTRRDEAEAKRAAETQAREEATERKLDEKRRREEEKAAAEQARRDEAEAKRAAAIAAAEQQRREGDAARAAAAPEPPRAVPDHGDPTDEEDARISAELIARLRAYGHGDGSESASKDEG